MLQFYSCIELNKKINFNKKKLQEKTLQQKIATKYWKKTFGDII